MPLFIKISSTLRDYMPGYDPMAGISMALPFAGATAAELATHLRLPLDEIKFVMINGRQQPMTTKLGENDRVAYFPPVGGG